MNIPRLLLALLVPALAPLRAAPLPPPGTGKPLTLVICGGDTFVKNTDVAAKLRRVRELGFTSVQTYVYWNQVEKTPGVLDWSAYDAEVNLYRAAGLKWVPFVVMGPWYLSPDFLRADPELPMLRCLDHDRDSLIPSIWAPRLRHYLREYLRKFAEHYGPMGVIESVNIGISGDYGEAIYPVIGNWAGSYHSHSGYWCGDALAAQDFRRHAEKLYPAGIASLNAAWKTNYPSFADVKPFPPYRAPSERAWQEFLAWYRDSMTNYADWCLQTTREFFPQDQIYLCTGGDMAPSHGSDFSQQARVAAKHRAGIRITNEGSSFPVNMRYTRLVGTSSRHYGAYFGHEPAALVTPEGMVGRIFNALTSGADQLFSYDSDDTLAPRTLEPGPKGDYLRRYRGLLNQQTPRIETAIYFPNLSAEQMRSEEGARISMFRLGDLLTDLRRFIDYDLLDDQLLQEGGLDTKSILIVAGTEVMPAATLDRIAAWVRRGGLCYFLGSRPVDWDGSTRGFDELAGITPRTDVVDAISNDGIVLPRPDLLPSIAKLSGVYIVRGSTELAADTEPLIAYQYGVQARAAWRRKLGAGTLYVYFATMDLKQDEASWMVSQQLPLRFIRDTLESSLREKLIRELPASLHLGEPDIYKVMTDAGLWVLNMGAVERNIEYQGRTVHVPAHSIVQPPPTVADGGSRP